MTRTARSACILMGAWLALTPFMWFAATRTYRSVDRVLAVNDPDFQAAIKPIHSQTSGDSIRPVLRHLASEINRSLFAGYSATQIALGMAVLLLLFRSSPRDNVAVALTSAMLALVLLLARFVQPQIVALGRQIDFGLPPAGIVHRFWTFHVIFTVLDGVKLILGLGVAVRAALRG